MSTAIQVVTATANQADAENIAAALLQQQLAACVQVSGPVVSRYRWKGVLETAEEWVCTIKTLSDAYPQVEQRIRELHPYELPEIVATPIVAASQAYLEWLTQQVHLATHAPIPHCDPRSA